MLQFLTLLAVLSPAPLFADPEGNHYLSRFLRDRYYEVDCAQLFCGYLSANPKVYLHSVNPDPLPEREPGDPQTVQLHWSSEHGLKTDFKLCLTASPSASPDAADDCVDLTNYVITMTTNRRVHFEETVTVPGAMRKAEAAFYIRSTASLYIFGRPPASQLSNRVPFEWPYPRTNLYASHANVTFPGSSVQAHVRVTNTTQIDAPQVNVQFHVLACDGNQPAPQDPGSTDGDQLLCYATAETFVGSFTTGVVTVPGVQAMSNATASIDITSQLPAQPRNLWVTVVGVVDPNNQLAESNETDNSDDDTDYVPRP